MKHFFFATLFLLGCSSSSGATDAATADVQATDTVTVDTVTVDTVTVDTVPPMDVRPDVASDTVTVDHPDAVTLDAGADAGADAGGGEGAECTTASECGAGLLCCYPCGIPGCRNRCMAPMGGRCPLIP